MAKLNFDKDKIMREMLKQGLETMKKEFTRDVNAIARSYGETPKITFKSKGPKSFEASVEVESDELRAKIDQYVKKRSR
jgi:hypothetical protein